MKLEMPGQQMGGNGGAIVEGLPNTPAELFDYRRGFIRLTACDFASLLCLECIIVSQGFMGVYWSKNSRITLVPETTSTSKVHKRG